LSIVKALIMFIITSLVVFAVSAFIPKYHEVQREQLQSLLKQLDYKETSEGEASDLSDINNVMDTIPVRAALSYKGKIISSNLSKDSRASAGEDNIQTLTKNVQAGDMTLNYKEDDPANKSLWLIIPLFSGLVCAGVIMFMSRTVETAVHASQGMREDLERLQTLNDMYQQKEEEFNRKIDKQIPDNLEETQKLLKSMLKEKEVILAEMDKFTEKEEDLKKDIVNGKMQLGKQKEVNNTLETKIRELQGQLSAAAKQEKQLEEQKVKIDKQAEDFKDLKKKLKVYEKTDIDAIKAENSELKAKASETEEKGKAVKEELKELKKLDAEKLQAELETEKLEKEELKKEIKETKQQLKEAMTGLEGSDAGQLKIDNIEYQKTIKNLQKELSALQGAGGTGEDAVKVDNIRNQLKEKDIEIENLKSALKGSSDIAESLKKGVSPEVISTLEDKQTISTLMEKVHKLQEDLNNRPAGGGTGSEELEELLREKDEQISDMRKQIINRELEVKRLKSDGGSSVPDFDLDAFEADLQKSKNLALKYKKERDDKIKNINTLNAAFEASNETLKRKEEELDSMDEKYRSKITEVKSQMESQTAELMSLNSKYRIKIDELKSVVDQQTEEINKLRGTSDIQMPG
jgi:chromosome segregation ATPase